MVLFDIIYNITIYPIEFIIETLFYLFKDVFQSSYGVSLFLLSLCVNFMSLPIYNVAEFWKNKEIDIQNKMKPDIEHIKKTFKGDKRFLLIQACYKIYGYKTIYAFRGTLGILIQIPFFMAAYNFVHSLTSLNGAHFLFIKDLSKPDALIHIGSFNINLLPFLMTLFSLLSGFVYSKKLKFKDKIPLYIVSFIFLVLLYNSPSGLLFYWTINCLFSLIKNIFIEYRLYTIFVINKYKLLKIYNIFFIIVTALFILFISLGNIERKAYLNDFNYLLTKGNKYLYSAKINYYSKIFKSSDIFEFNCNVNNLTKYINKIEILGDNIKYATVELNENIDNIKENIYIYYTLYPKTYSINIYTFLLIFTILINIGKIYNFIFNDKDVSSNFIKYRNKLAFLSCLIISLLSGIFIPTSLISSSPNEFINPFYLIFNNFSMSLGLFLFYPLFIYLLFSDKMKNYFTLLFIFSVFIVFINTFVMTGNYININSDFIFDNYKLIIFSFKDILLMLALIVLSFCLFMFIIKKKKINIFINIYYIVLIVFLFISGFHLNSIIKSHNQLMKNSSSSSNNAKIFNLSKTGENIFVFILDRAVNSYWIDALNRFPEYNEKLDGFVIYPNTVSFGVNTTTIASLYGGYDYLPYELSTNGTYNIKYKHNESLLMLPLSLEKYGYKSTILDPTYANFQWIPDLSIFEGYTNIKAYNNDKIMVNSLEKYFGDTNISFLENNLKSQKKKIIRFSIFKMIPINLRYDFYMKGKWFYFDEASKVNVNSSIYNYAILNNIKNTINISDEGNYYNILHNMITHEPSFFHSDYLPYPELGNVKDEDLLIYKDEFSAKHFYANVSSINILIDFIKFLKDNDVYDNTKIILISDHGGAVNKSNTDDLDKGKFLNMFNALFMYKDFNSSGNLKIDTNFMTIIVTKHIPNIKNVFDNKIITNNYKTNGAYIIQIKGEIYEQSYNYYNFDYYYFVKNNMFDINNWKKFEIDWNTKNVREIK